MSQLKAQKVWYLDNVQLTNIFNLICMQEKLTEELREAMKKSRKESELNTVDSQIRGLDTRLKYAKKEMESAVSDDFFIICY
jgi:chaperonin cofactor prefoldin